MEDNDSNLRYEAVAAVGKMNDIRSAEPLIRALNDTDSDVREEAAKALANIRE